MNADKVKARIREAITQTERGCTGMAVLALTWALREVVAETDERYEDPDTIAGLCSELVRALER